jgi:hypothetical protein
MVMVIQALHWRVRHKVSIDKDALAYYKVTRYRYQPLLLFFFIACLVATLFLVGWGSYWGGLPEFSEVGIIG